jgi:hypothetical protein
VMQIEYDSLTSKLESNPHVMSTTKILSLRYLDLPLYLKSSFKVVSYLSLIIWLKFSSCKLHKYLLSRMWTKFHDELV